MRCRGIGGWIQVPAQLELSTAAKKIGASGCVKGARRRESRCHRDGTNELCGRTRVLLVYVNGSYFDIDKGGLNVGVAHEAHEGGKTHASTHTISVAKVCLKQRCGLALETPVVRRCRNRERRPAGVMRVARARPFRETDKAGWQRWAAQAEIVIQKLDGFGANGSNRGLLPLPLTRICASGNSTSSQLRAITSRERRPCNNISPTMARSREVPEARPESRHLIHGERDDGAFGLSRVSGCGRGTDQPEAHRSVAPVIFLEGGATCWGASGKT